jgi:hypothetical protein
VDDKLSTYFSIDSPIAPDFRGEANHHLPCGIINSIYYFGIGTLLLKKYRINLRIRLGHCLRLDSGPTLYSRH